LGRAGEKSYASGYFSPAALLDDRFELSAFSLFPMQRSPLESILNVAHSENKLSWQVGVSGVR